MFKSKDQRIGGGMTMGAGFSRRASQSKVDANYASVGEQSGINAGDGGFQVNVKGNTDLKGGKIASTDKAVEDGKNSLTTGTLTTSEIENRSQYKAESQSVSAGGGNWADPSQGKPGGGIGIGSTSGSESSVTRSGVTGAAITITDAQAQQAKTGQSAEQAIALLDQNVRTGKDSSNTLNKNWNGDELRDEVEAQAKITQAFGQRAAKAIGDYAGAKETELRQAATKAALGGDQESADSLNAEAAKWADGGVYRVVAHAAIGALAGGVGGALGATASASLMPDIATQIKKMELPQEVESALSLAAAAGLGAAVGGNTGAASGFNVDLNNRQLHQSEYDIAKKNAKLVAQKLNISDLEAEGRILAEMLRNSDKQTAEAAGGIHDYEIIGLVGCQMLNCNGHKNDPQYTNHDYNSEFIPANQNAYNLGQGKLDTGLSDQEYRNKNIVNERIGKAALALTGCALAGPTVCKSAVTGLGLTLFISYGTDSPVTTAGAIGAAYGGILGAIYAQNLALWAGDTSSFMQSATLFITKTGSTFGGKQSGIYFGNTTSLGGSVDPLLDPKTNPWWGAMNTWNLVRGGK